MSTRLDFVMSISSPVVSVLLPVFNGSATLKAAMRSILGQTYSDFELLVIDDGSTDGSAEIAKSLGDERIIVIGNSERQGLAARLNEGIDFSRGRYIARMDADDLAFPKRFEEQVIFLEAHHDIDLIACRVVAFFDDPCGKTNIIGLLPFEAKHEDICKNPWRGFPMPHPTWMGRADWFRRYHYAMPEVRRAEDQDLLLRSHASSRFACLGEVLQGYLQYNFDLKKTLTARRHFLVAQLRYFISVKQWKMAAFALSAGLLKSFVDVMASLPYCDKLFFVRMGGAVPNEVVRELNRLRRLTL